MKNLTMENKLKILSTLVLIILQANAANGTKINSTGEDVNSGKSLLSLLQQQPLAEINISIPLLKGNGSDIQSFYAGGQKSDNDPRPFLGIDLFPKAVNKDQDKDLSMGNQFSAKDLTLRQGLSNHVDGVSIPLNKESISNYPPGISKAYAANKTSAMLNPKPVVASHNNQPNNISHEIKYKGGDTKPSKATKQYKPSINNNQNNNSVNNRANNDNRIADNQPKVFSQLNNNFNNVSPGIQSSQLTNHTTSYTNKNNNDDGANIQQIIGNVKPSINPELGTDSSEVKISPYTNPNKVVNSGLPTKNSGKKAVPNSNLAENKNNNVDKMIHQRVSNVELNSVVDPGLGTDTSDVTNAPHTNPDRVFNSGLPTNSSGKKAVPNSNLSANQRNQTRHTNATKVHILPNKQHIVESKLTSKDRDWCNETTVDSIACRGKIGQKPHMASSEFSGNIGVTQSNLNGTQKLGGEASRTSNETLNFKLGKSTYDYQNLTDFHNCSGCLKNQKLIQHNKTKTDDVPEKNGKNEEEQNGFSEISRIRNKLRNTTSAGDRENFLVRNISRNANKTDPLKYLNLNNMTKSKNNESITKNNQSKIGKNNESNARNNGSMVNINESKNRNNASYSKTDDSSQVKEDRSDSKDDSSKVKDERSQTRGEIIQRRCEEIDTKRNQIGNKNGNIDGIVTSCVTKRRLVSTKHTKTKKNGKVTGEKDESDKVTGQKDEGGDKSLQNNDRAESNEENAKSNEERKHQSDKNNNDNSKLALSNEKVLQDILRGDDGKPKNWNKTIAEDDHHHDIENMTIKLDPTIIQQRLHSSDDEVGIKPPDKNHLDEDTGMMGIDERPAIEDTDDLPSKTKTNKTLTNNTNNKNETSEETKKGHESSKEKQGSSKESHGESSKEKQEDSSKEKLKSAKDDTTKTDESKEVLPLLKNADNTKNNNSKSLEKDHSFGKNVTKSFTENVNNTADEIGSALQSNDTATLNITALETNSNDTSSNNGKELNERPTKRIMAFGDSLTTGLFIGNSGVPRYNAYATRLSELLQKGDRTKEFKVFEEGVNGECACSEMSERLSRELDERKNVDLLIIIAGTNDLLKNDCIRQCDLYEAIKKLHEIAKKRGIKSVVTTIMLSTFSPAKMTSKEYKETLFDVNQKLRGYARQEETVKQMKLCDIADEFPRKASISLDKIHPSAQGYDVLADILYECIKDFKF